MPSLMGAELDGQRLSPYGRICQPFFTKLSHLFWHIRVILPKNTLFLQKQVIFLHILYIEHSSLFRISIFDIRICELFVSNNLRRGVRKTYSKSARFYSFLPIFYSFLFIFCNFCSFFHPTCAFDAKIILPFLPIPPNHLIRANSWPYFSA